MALGRDVEEADAGTRVQPRVAVRERGQRVDEVVLLAEVAAVLQIRRRHLGTLQGGVVHRRSLGRGHLGRVDGLGEQSLVAVGFFLQVGGHIQQSDGDGLSLSPPAEGTADDSATYKPNRTQTESMTEDAIEHRRLIVAGTGIAGLTAAIYAARSNNDPLVLEGDEPGGQLTLTSEVENYPGFPEGLSGPDLINKMKEQAEQFGSELKHGVVESVDGGESPFTVELSNGDVYTCDAFIAASGASARTLGVPGEDELMGYGVSTCATCDGAFFRGEDMLVVGGGDAAMEEAHFLTKFADTVYIAHRREEFRAEDYWIDKVGKKVESGEIEIMRNTELLEIHGSAEDGVDHVTLAQNDEGHPSENLDADGTETFDFDVGAVFMAIGHTPNTDYLKGTDVELDDAGYIVAEGGKGGGQTATDVEGIFGAGDIVDYHYQQAVTAAGMGCKAAMDADEYLEDLPEADAESEAAAEADD